MSVETSYLFSGRLMHITRLHAWINIFPSFYSTSAYLHLSLLPSLTSASPSLLHGENFDEDILLNCVCTRELFSFNNYMHCHAEGVHGFYAHLLCVAVIIYTVEHVQPAHP